MTIAHEVARLRDAPVDELAALHLELAGEDPPTRHRGNLFRRVAWLVQAREYGGLDDATQARLDAAVDALDIDLSRPPPSAPKRTRRGDGLAVGTVLTRTYKGREYAVTVTDEGFDYQGMTYASLSAVARVITGAKWNGKLFFGLTKRSRDR